MKKISFCIFISIFFAQALWAQDVEKPEPKQEDLAPVHIFTVAPLGLVNKFRAQYEYNAGTGYSLGLMGSYYYPGEINYASNGYKFDLFGRKYISRKEQRQGFYMQAAVSAGKHYSSREIWDNPNEMPRIIDREHIAGGIGGAVGIANFQRSSLAIDISLGLQAYIPIKYNDYFAQDWWDLDELQWFTIGPGHVLQLRVLIGFAM